MQSVIGRRPSPSGLEVFGRRPTTKDQSQSTTGFADPSMSRVRSSSRRFNSVISCISLLGSSSSRAASANWRQSSPVVADMSVPPGKDLSPLRFLQLICQSSRLLIFYGLSVSPPLASANSRLHRAIRSYTIYLKQSFSPTARTGPPKFGNPPT